IESRMLGKISPGVCSQTFYRHCLLDATRVHQGPEQSGSTSVLKITKPSLPDSLRDRQYDIAFFMMVGTRALWWEVFRLRITTPRLRCTRIHPLKRLANVLKMWNAGEICWDFE